MPNRNTVKYWYFKHGKCTKKHWKWR